MVYRINPNREPLWRNPFELQLGAGKNSVVLGKLTASQERLIAALYKGIADQQLPLITKQLGLSEVETHEVLHQVGDVLVAESPVQKKTTLDSEFIAAAFSEIIRASLTNSISGEAVLLDRSARAIHVETLNRAGLLVALGLASGGIGQIISHDQSAVLKSELGPTGYPTQLLGAQHIDALRSLLAASPNSVIVSSGQKLSEKKLQKLDCAVLIAQQVIEPRRYATWMNRDVPHLVITFDSESVSVSPVIIPGQTPCLFCFESARTDANPNWPVLATQLSKSNKRFDDAASALFGAGLATQKILSMCDRSAGFNKTAENPSGFSLELANGELTEYTWTQHAACNCKPDGT